MPGAEEYNPFFIPNPADRNPIEDCTDERCPFVTYPHSVELVPKTNVRVHYAVDPEAMKIRLLWIHDDDKPWPTVEESEAIRKKIDLGDLGGKPWDK